MRLIDADMLEPSEVYMNYGFTRIVYMDDIDEMPTVDAEPVRHGHWIEGNNFHWYSNSCSCCGYTRTTDIKSNGWNQWKYCPNCGAKMDEVTDETD